MKAQITTLLLLMLPALSFAQVPVDEDGKVIGQYESQADVMPIGEDGIPQLTRAELQELVGPIALYPDDLLAIVLPASAYPLQVVEAARFLEALKSDSSLEPNPDWDDSIVALINYPEVIELLNEDLDWTWRLGEAVVSQQTDVVSAVESFRDVAYAAGNLKSDEYQTVSRDEGAISISPNAEDVIYVPYYEPTRVVHYQPRPVYYYHPHAYPVYYYPYAAGHQFDRGLFWGVTTAFTIGWMSNSLNVYHHSYYGHPYYGHSYYSRSYWNDRWYRQPSINVYNTTYVNNTNVTVNRHSSGDQWRARNERREYVRREGYARHVNRDTRTSGNSAHVTQPRRAAPISFRERDPELVSRARDTAQRGSIARDTRRQDAIEDAREGRRSVNTRQRTSPTTSPTASTSPVRHVSRPATNVDRTSVDRSNRGDRSPNRSHEQRSREPREQTPTHSQPTRATPTRTAPTRAAPVRTAPVRTAPTHAAPTRTAPARSESKDRSRSKDRERKAH